MWYRQGDNDSLYAVAGATDINFPIPGDYSKLNEQYIRALGAWGYKVFVGFDKEWIDVSVSYKWWEGNAAASVQRPPAPDGFLYVPGTAGDWEQISATQRTRYQVGSIWVGVPVGTACGLVTSIHCMARVIDLDQRVRIDAANPTFPPGAAANTVGRGLARSRFQGGGVGFGLSQEGELPFKHWTTGGYFCFLGIIGNSSMSISQFRIIPLANNVTPGQDLTLRLTQQRYWVPALEAATFFSYTYACGDVEIKVRFGYEWNIYFNALYETPAENFTARGRPVSESQGANVLRDTSHKLVAFGGPTIFVGAIY